MSPLLHLPVRIGARSADRRDPSPNTTHRPSTRPPGRLRARGGGEAVEFALIAPVLVLLVFGIAEFGWYYFEHAQCSVAVEEALRLGSIQAPTEAEEGTGHCAACLEAARTYAQARLSSLGISTTADEVTPRLVDVGGACTLVLDARIDHDPLLGFSALPEHYVFHASAAVPAVTGCAPDLGS